MRSAWFKRLGLALVGGWLAVASVGATSGCASTRDEINRVQPNYVKKSDLVGDYRDLRGAPEWYMRSLVLGVQRTNPFTSDGLQDLGRRVKFEIQERYLIVRRSYELIANTDFKGGGAKPNSELYTVKTGDTLESIAASLGTKPESIARVNVGGVKLTPGSTITLPGNPNTGTIVAVYPIEQHFDIKNVYNPATGEDTNVVDENMSDRRWYEREFIRVDWSRNLAIDPDLFEFWFPKAFGELEMQNVQYYENKPDSPEASNLAEFGNGYFDVTSRWIIKPQMIDYWGERIPQCLLANFMQNAHSYADGTVECNDQEVVLRTAFMKLDPDKSTDYEVFETEGQQQQIVGTLDLDRYGYDRQYGIVDQTWHQYVQRYNIWEKSHTDTVCGENNDKKAGDETCEAAKPNSYCDLNAKKCTIPYVDRKIKPVAFFADAAIPEPLVPGTGKAVAVWNDAVTAAVAYAREAECRRAGGERNSCHAKYFEGDGSIDLKNPDKPKAENGPTVVFCHNPVAKGDHESCGPEGKKVRKGDIRYHMLAYWANPSFESPLGVVVWPGDPMTGENIGSMANVFGGTFDHAVAYYRDMIQLVNGDISPSDFVNGKSEEMYSSAQPVFSNGPTVDPALDALSSTISAGKRFGDGMTKAEIDARIKGVDVSSTVARMGLVKALAGLSTIEEKEKAAKAYMMKQGAMGTPGFGGIPEYNKKLSGQMAKGIKGGLEAKAVNDQMVSSFGLDPSKTGTATATAAVSPFRAMNPAFIASVRDTFEAHWAKRACRLPGMEDAFTWNHFDGIAAKLKARYPDGSVASGPIAKMAGVDGQTVDVKVRGKLIFWELAEPVYVDVLVHEMGHAFSEDHDFGGTWDSVNYFPQYWQLRTADGKANKVCPPDAPRSKTGPDTCTGPRYLDPLSADELGTVPGKEHDAIEEYATASIMDYHSDSRYWPVGLGAYDKMAAKFIYGRVVETFDDPEISLIPKKFVPLNPDGTPNNAEAVTDVPKGIAPTMESMLGGDWRVKRNVSGIGNFAQAMHYTQVGRMLNLYDEKRCRPSTDEENKNGIAQYGKVCQAPHRDHFFVRDMDSGDINGANTFTGYWKSGEKSGAAGKVRWPYKYGPSAFANYPHIAVFDSGADFYEVTQDIVNWYEFYYLTGFYRRHNKEWSPYNTASWLYQRVYRRFHLLAWDSINGIVRYNSFFPGTAPDANPITLSDDWGRPEILSMTLLFDVMQRALLRPQPGGYVTTNPVGMALPLATVPEAALDKPEFTVGGIDARYIDNAYDVVANGYDYQAAIKRVGSHSEKFLATIGLTDSRPPLSTVARETFLDGRNVMFSFRSALPKAFDRLLAGTFAEDWDSIAPYVIPGEKATGPLPVHQMQLWNFDGKAITRPAGAKVIDPMVGYRTQVPSMIFALLFQPIDSNMEMVQRTRIWVEGSKEAISVPVADKVTFYDPVDGLQWGATKFGTETMDGRTVQIGIGARILEHANRLLALGYNVATDSSGLPVYGPDGRPVVTGGGAITVKDAAAAAKLKAYTSFLNELRSALNIFGFGPLHGFEEDE